MGDNDEDYVPYGSPFDETPSQNLRERVAAAPVEDSGRKRARRASNGPEEAKEEAPYHCRLPDTLETIQTMKEKVSRLLRGHDYDAAMSLRVIRMALSMQEEYLLAQRKNAERKISRPRIRETIIRHVGLSSSTYSSILRQFLTDEQVYSSAKANGGRGGARVQQQTRVARTRLVQRLVREHVREERSHRRRVTGKQVVDFLVSKSLLHIPKDDDGVFVKMPFESAYRSVRRWLVANGYRRGKRGGNIVLKAAIAAKRDIYLTQFFDNRAKGPLALREVYLDESYCHHHYHYQDQSLWDPNDDQDVQVGKMPHKGGRFCFAAAIQGPDPRREFTANVDEQQEAPVECKAGVVPGSFWKFCPQSKADHKGDYHKVFHGGNFNEWMRKQVYPNLSQPSLIIMDNAKYHKVLPEGGAKRSKMVKKDMQDYLTAKGIEWNVRETVAMLTPKIDAAIAIHQRMAVEEEAEANGGHKIMFTPPYHSDLQPIELVWAHTKGRVGRQYDDSTTLKKVGERIDKEFADLEERGHDLVGKIIDKTLRVHRKFFEDATKDDGAEDIAVPAPIPVQHEVETANRDDDSDAEDSVDSIDIGEGDEDGFGPSVSV